MSLTKYFAGAPRNDKVENEFILARQMCNQYYSLWLL